VATSFRQNGTDANNNVKADVAALYLQDQIAFTKQWKAIVGLRYDHFKVSFDDRRTLVPATDLARTDDAFSPRAGLIWQPTAASTYYVSYSESFLPSGEQLGLAATTVDLDPETARNYEVGGRWDLRPKLTLSGAVFRTDRNNVRVADPANPGFFVKTGQLRSTGFELGLQGEVTQRWQVYGGYSNLNARALKAFNTGTTASATTTVGAGTKLGLVPEHTFSLWNRFDLADGWGAGLGVIYQGASYTTISNAVTLPAFTRADAALFYTFSDRRTRLAVNVENLFDRKYFPTADNDNNISPGAPRTLRVTLSTSF
jgi:catecholate siderophore receptor